ncbi:zinc finger BED domain-containing protein DAYSLEEPER-like [Euphorbia lathyris]|uniref:zinc finger BED domain-containing protein DAYSLEEPER-like n=1 Tax=Euphorbia lathyris TaxID=212925 RepID=UPI0033141D5A
MSQEEGKCCCLPKEAPNKVDFETVSETGDSDDVYLANCRKSVAVFIILDEHPFEMVESENFIELMSELCPKLELPSAQTLSQDCYKLYLDEKLKLQKFLETNSQNVCLAIDVWNSPQGLNYIGVTAHFIDDDWKLQRKILHFVPNPLSSGEEIGSEIESCLLDWGIINKVFTITMDHTSFSDDAVVYLKGKLIESGRGFRDCKYLHMKCFAHIVNLVVVEALEEAKLAVNRVREAVRYVKFNRGRGKMFKECVEAEKIECTERLFVDVSYMWNTTYVMLCRVEKYEKAFDRYAKLDREFTLGSQDGLPSSVDWCVVRKLCVILRPFYDVMLNISRCEFATSNNFWADISDLYAVFSEWGNGDDLKLRNVANRMKLRLEEWFGGYEKMNKIVYVAAILDPRSKLEVLQFAFEQIYGEEKGSVLLKNVKEAMFEMFDEYCKNSAQVTVVEQSNEVFNEDHKNFFMLSYKKQRLETGDKKSELESYLNDPTEDVDTDDFDVLKWWKSNSDRFPILARMARDILAIPKSTVRPDLAFNTNEKMLDEYKGGLEYEILQALICAQNWLRKSPLQVDIVKEFEENEIMGEEMFAEFGEFGPSMGGWSDSD